MTHLCQKKVNYFCYWLVRSCQNPTNFPFFFTLGTSFLQLSSEIELDRNNEVTGVQSTPLKKKKGTYTQKFKILDIHKKLHNTVKSNTFQEKQLAFFTEISTKINQRLKE